MKTILIAICFFYAYVAKAGGNGVQDALSGAYTECNIEGLQQSRIPIDDKNFIAQLSLERAVYELLLARNEELSIFLADKNKISEPDYIDQAMEFFRRYLESELECLRDAYEDGDVVYKFQQYEDGSKVEGFAVANSAVKAVLYTVVVTE